jgi:hypothetical protein
MSNLKLCQGTKCHEYKTKDRIRGSKGDKHYETRRRSEFYYGQSNFCSLNCQTDWFNKFGDMAINHFGRLREPKQVGCDSAWYKDYKYNYNNGSNSNYDHYFINDLLGQRISITEQQYNNTTTDNINQLVIQQNSKS